MMQKQQYPPQDDSGSHENQVIIYFWLNLCFHNDRSWSKVNTSWLHCNTTNARYPRFDPALDIPGPRREWEGRARGTGPSRKGKLGNCDEKCLTWTKYWAVRDLLNSHYVVLRYRSYCALLLPCILDHLDHCAGHLTQFYKSNRRPRAVWAIGSDQSI